MLYFIVSKAIIFLFFVLPIFFRNKLGSEDEIKIKIKFIRTIKSKETQSFGPFSK